MKTPVIQLVKVNMDSGETREAAKKREASLRLEGLREGHLPPIYVVVTRTFRRYGGPEEGGWWYDWTDIEEIRRVWGLSSALKALRELKEEHPTDRYGRGSVCGNSGDVVIFLTRNQDQI